MSSRTKWRTHILNGLSPFQLFPQLLRLLSYLVMTAIELYGVGAQERDVTHQFDVVFGQAAFDTLENLTKPHRSLDCIRVRGRVCLAHGCLKHGRGRVIVELG